MATNLVCPGHTRPVVHLDFSDNTDSGYYLISACKGKRRGDPVRQEGSCRAISNDFRMGISRSLCSGESTIQHSADLITTLLFHIRRVARGVISISCSVSVPSCRSFSGTSEFITYIRQVNVGTNNKASDIQNKNTTNSFSDR